ncbi:MAG: epoxyqueuosine reductase QueH, partial [Oscillospiraceae bacterium]
MKRNYGKETDKIIQSISEDDKPTLLLHSCCAPCSSYVLEYLSPYFRITVLYYNPNIFPEEEYNHRINEEKRFIKEFSENNGLPEGYISFAEIGWESEKFYDAVKGYEHIPEGGERCFRCYRLRLEAAAEYAKEHDFDYFTTTLTISPMKNAEKLNEIGEELSGTYNVKFLPSDFKKKGGFLRSTELSREYGLYRQDYCGCVFSKNERDDRINNRVGGCPLIEQPTSHTT